MKLTFGLFASFSTVLLVSGAARAEIVNGSFENPALGAVPAFHAYSTGKTIGSGWVVGSGGLAEIITSNYVTATWPGASEGTNFSISTTSGYVNQELDFTASSTGTYRLILTSDIRGTNIDNVVLNVLIVPEPSTILLVGMAFAILVSARYLKKKSASFRAFSISCILSHEIPPYKS